VVTNLTEKVISMKKRFLHEDALSESSFSTLKSLIESGKPSSILRFGSLETRMCYDYRDIPNHHPPENLIKILKQNTGFYCTDPTAEVDVLKRFADISLKAYAKCDYVASTISPQNEAYAFVGKCMTLVPHLDVCYVPSYVQTLNRWMPLLEGLKVLVISPFPKSIASQLEHKSRLFENGPNAFQFPQCEISLYQAHNTILGNTPFPCENWVESFEQMASEISCMDFDLALVGAGAYGVPLCSAVKDMGKIGFHVASAVQLAFGLMGKRWRTYQHIQEFYNDFWNYPLASETPKSAHLVESGCYWNPDINLASS